MSPYYDDGQCVIYNRDALSCLQLLAPESVQMCVTSPPYWGLRDYNVKGQLGLEKTPEEFVAKLVAIFREVHRVLKKNGTIWVNLGDSYCGGGNGGGGSFAKDGIRCAEEGTDKNVRPWWKKGKAGSMSGCKPKDLVGVPWMVAFALRADGWFLRQDIIWCLSGGAWLYAKTQKGTMPIMVRDMARLDPASVELWIGEKSSLLRGMSKSARRGDEVELVLRSGERISCTPTHRFPTNRGLLPASEIKVLDMLESTLLPEPENPRDCVIDEDAAWFAGLYIAEGSRFGDKIHLAGHRKESERAIRTKRIAAKFGGSAQTYIDGNNQTICVFGKFLNAIIDELVTGRTSKDKGIAPVVWRYSNRFLASLVDGYLSGDGHYEAKNRRWRLGFCRNYNLERDLRTACARLGYHLILNPRTTNYEDRQLPTFRGELRKTRSGHGNQKNPNEVVAIRRARCREVYDLGVADEPHLFALSSGILTHNSKPNPMPESVKDRCTKSHEYIFLLSKSPKYFYDADAIRCQPSEALLQQIEQGYNGHATKDFFGHKAQDASDVKARIIEGHRKRQMRRSDLEDFGLTKGTGNPSCVHPNGVNKRSVWTVKPQGFADAHFATFPPDLIKPCILAGSKHGDTVLDPFFGSGTSGMVSVDLGRRCIGIELNPDYCAMAQRRVQVTPGLPIA